MTIPNLIANTNGAKFRSGFKKAISTLNQAGLMAQAQYDFDYAGTVSSCRNGVDEVPEVDMTMCSLLNGTLTGKTFRGYVYEISTQKQSSSGSTASSYTLLRREVIPSDYNSYFAYTLADGSIVAFNNMFSSCTLNIGADLSDELTSSLVGCRGFIDVNGTTLPNKEVRCSTGSTTTDVNDSNCYVKNNANDMTDVFPIVFHDATVEPASNAAKYVLTTSK